MKLEVHILSHDDEQFLPWALRHWSRFASDIVVHDGGPTGLPASDCIAKTDQLFPVGPCISRLNWDTAGQLNDELARRLKNECWRGTDADWVAIVDADELLYFPGGAASALSVYEKSGAAVIKPSGFEMFSEEWIEPTMFAGQITELVKDGSPDDKWYSKPVLFSPKRIAESGFGIGAHESAPVLRDGRRFKVGRDWPKANPPAYLLHFKSIFGGLERIATRYDATRTRLAQVNVRNNWGNFKPGIVHAQEKRDLLLPGVRRVIA